MRAKSSGSSTINEKTFVRLLVHPWDMLICLRIAGALIFNSASTTSRHHESVLTNNLISKTIIPCNLLPLPNALRNIFPLQCGSPIEIHVSVSLFDSPSNRAENNSRTNRKRWFLVFFSWICRSRRDNAYFKHFKYERSGHGKNNTTVLKSSKK